MNTNVRFGGYAVRREFRRGLTFRGSMPPKDALARARGVRYYRSPGDNVSPYRAYQRYKLLYRIAKSSFQGFPKEWDDSDTARFSVRRSQLKGDKQRINRAYRRVFKQQIHNGLESPSEFEFPQTVHNLNITW